MNLPHREKLGRSFWLGLLSLALFLFIATPLSALADNVVQGFAEKGTLQPGWIVAVDPTSSTTVEAAPANDESRIYGVVVNQGAAPITLNQPGQQVFVANSGNYPVLVSVVNGTISPGDYISMSNTDGIGAKATGEQTTVLGRATTGFDGQNNVLTGSGQTAVGRINVSIAPGRNPSQKTGAAPSALQKLASSIAGHPVSASRVWAATAVFVVACGIAITLLVVGVRTGMIAIGRNPLSKHSILIGLFQVISMSVLIFIVGLFGVYLLLKL